VYSHQGILLPEAIIRC